MEWMEIYAWLERYAGVSYDVTSMFDDCKGTVALQEPYMWYTDMNEIVMHFHSIEDVIEEHGHQIPEGFNSAAEFIEMIKGYFIENLTAIIFEIRDLLNMQHTNIVEFDDIEEIIGIVYKIIEIAKDSDDDEFNKIFDKLDKQYDGRITDFYGVHESQLFTMSRKIKSLVEEETDN